MIVVQLEADSLKLEVALFGDYVDEVNNFIANYEVNRAVIVIQFAKVKKFKGKRVLQNVMFETWLLFDPDIPEVARLKNSLLPANDEMSQSLSSLDDGPS